MSQAQQNAGPLALVGLHTIATAVLIRANKGVNIPKTTWKGNYYTVSSVVLLAIGAFIVQKAPDKDSTEEKSDKIALLLIAAALAINAAGTANITCAHVCGLVGILTCVIVATAA